MDAIAQAHAKVKIIKIKFQIIEIKEAMVILETKVVMDPLVEGMNIMETIIAMETMGAIAIMEGMTVI